MDKFKGTGIALVTPFDDENRVDTNAIERLVNHCIEGGVDYLVVMGTTGEYPVLSEEEKLEALNAIKEVNNGRLPLVYGMGANNTQALADKIKETNFDGIDAILSVSPYYNKPSQEGIYQHFKVISEASPLPVILYNVPGRTSSNMTAETTLRLASDFDNIIGVKEASGDMDQVMAIIKDRPEGFLVISGEDNLTLPMIACGGDGVISVSGQGFPVVFSEMVKQSLAGNFEKARNLHYKLFDVTNMLFAEGNPCGIKAALEIQGICNSKVRQPLWPISGKLRQNIADQIEKYQL